MKDRIALINEMIAAPHVNDVLDSVNANSQVKSINSIISHALAEEKINIGWGFLSNYLKDIAKYKNAHDEGSIYIHDIQSLGIPYCFSFDFSKVLYEDTFFGGLQSKKIKRIDSYISYVRDAVSIFSQQIAGACGLGSFFLDLGTLLYNNNEPIDGSKDYEFTNLLQGFVHSVNHLSRGDQSAFTNLSLFDEETLKFIPSVIPEHIPYILYIQELFLNFFLQGDPSRGGAPFTFPVVTVNISKPDSTILKGVLSANPDRVNFNINKNGSKFAMCCRLVLDLAEKARILGNTSASFSNSPISIGSHRVVTINFNRLAILAFSQAPYDEKEDLYYKLLDELIFDIVVPFLEGHRKMLEGFQSKHLLPLFDQGWMRMKDLFSTVGILGLVEASQTLNKPSLIEDTLKHLTGVLEKVTEASGNMFNLEQVPGESARFKLAQKDRLHFGDVVKIPEFYANQFAPLISEDNFINKIKTEGRYFSAMTGGGIAHLRLPALPSPCQLEKIIKYCYDEGLDHFAISSTYSLCENDHLHLGNFETCPKCGAKIKTVFERPIGYWASVEAWGTASKTHDFPNRKLLTEDLIYSYSPPLAIPLP